MIYCAKKTTGSAELPQFVRTVQKDPYEEIFNLSGVAQRQRRHSCFCLDALVVVKVDVVINHALCFRKCPRFMPVNALRF